MYRKTRSAWRARSTSTGYRRVTRWSGGPGPPRP